MNGPNTHGALIRFPGGAAFVDGIPDKCDHQWDGPSYFVTVSGKLITIGTFLQWAGYTNHMRQDLIMFHQRAIGDEVVEGGTTCSKCKKLFTPNWFE